MQRAPKVGERVRYSGGLVVGPCTGVVYKIYPAYRWDDDLEVATWDLLPESEWSVGVTVDQIPDKWPYGSDGRFAPEVSDLGPIVKNHEATRSARLR
jgi:hypothetical protein